MTTRRHVRSVDLPATPERVFALLVTPSAIRGWWSATRAIVMPKLGGTWTAAWGDEDAPDYVTSATLSVFDPPRRLVFSDQRYVAKSGPLPFEAAFTTAFDVEPIAGGARLTVTQDGFPADAVADAFYAGCETGWRDTFEGIQRFLARRRVLFLCTGNSCRSQMAEGLLRYAAGERFDVASAGTDPQGLNPGAVAAMREAGIDISSHQSKSVEAFSGQAFDFVITVCDAANERCPVFPGRSTRLHWSFDDPAVATGSLDERMAVFRRVRDEIRERIDALVVSAN